MAANEGISAWGPLGEVHTLKGEAPPAAATEPLILQRRSFAVLPDGSFAKVVDGDRAIRGTAWEGDCWPPAGWKNPTAPVESVEGILAWLARECGKLELEEHCADRGKSQYGYGYNHTDQVTDTWRLVRYVAKKFARRDDPPEPDAREILCHQALIGLHNARQWVAATRRNSVSESPGRIVRAWQGR